ncbi:MAG: apolipoprotein N-acyltransferase [Candidatus Omnitrophica bacterium]|nr:apolipoprotein N-acyltransferase [Candidatus Omnitrophota bacterium]
MFLALISALLLILSFPKFSVWPLAWVALVPILFCMRRMNRSRHAFFYAFIFGFLFFFVTCEWLRHVSYFGWLVVATVCAFYFGVFGMAAHWFLKRNLFSLSLLVIPSAWAVLEWVRAEIPVWAFGWNLLAHTQSHDLSIAALASFVGAYGLSWLMVFANLSLFFLIDSLITRRKSEIPAILFASCVLAFILGLLFNSGSHPRPSHSADSIRVAVVQGNIPQSIKWDPNNKLPSLETHEQLSRMIASAEKPDLVIWPEAAFAGYLNVDPLRERVLDLERELDVPILLGSPFLDLSRTERETAYNSAYLVDERLSFGVRYDKVRLVPFGEYVPLRFLFGPLGLERLAYSLGVSDFVAGSEIKVFSLGEASQFSALICFEDTFPFLARTAVEKGAQFLAVITNDAWFGKSAAAYQHLDASIFRAIENGVPIVRAANTGVSAFIDHRGRVIDRVKDKQGNDTFIAGALIRSVTLEHEKTFYQKGGYRFPIYCLMVMVAGFMLTFKKKR